MPIDCPDGFKPEFKTKPVPPPPAPTSSSSANYKNLSLIKPLLTIFHKEKTNAAANCCVLVVDDEKSSKKAAVTFVEPHQTQPQQQQLSCSYSSIQFIDEDAKSRVNLNETTTTTATAYQSVAQDSAVSKPSVGKKLFEKQKNQLNCGAVNVGFEMDEPGVQEVDDNNKTIKKLTRAPTPPHPSSSTNLTCFNIIVPQTEDEDELENAKKIDQLKLIEEKFTSTTTNEPVPVSISPASCSLISSNKSNSFRLLETETTASNNLYPPNYLDYSALTSLSSISNNRQNLLETTTTLSVSMQQPQSCSRTYDIGEIFKHFDVLQSKLDLLKLNNNTTTTTTTVNSATNSADLFASNQPVKAAANSLSTTVDSDLDSLYKTCNNDINLIRKLIKTENFKNTLNLYNKFIKLSSKYDLRPITTDGDHSSSSSTTTSTSLSDEVGTYF
jgi:hypothetical protein